MNVIDLCGIHLCMDEAVCSYCLRRGRVYLCPTHLRELACKTKLSVQQIATNLPVFAWVGPPLIDER
jgi:hypothetical protein